MTVTCARIVQDRLLQFGRRLNCNFFAPGKYKKIDFLKPSL
ncbi:hypothetical protein CLOSYM_04448 [[Clostridium] symbiosum ATCC 14940]|uniref:Uncharacterized protein n=1 Tax=[Clostridium] symbiosum ATCC 14940 TaxID=411472 RepID=A0ABC9TS75_CLOSY|nr:hypothetical protein CLOSYM_04448 [[Clostridium] symbiosum ATCC 14940]